MLQLDSILILVATILSNANQNEWKPVATPGNRLTLPRPEQFNTHVFMIKYDTQILHINVRQNPVTQHIPATTVPSGVLQHASFPPGQCTFQVSNVTLRGCKNQGLRFAAT